MYILFPGRHHLLTQFQFDYLNQIIKAPSSIIDIHGKSLDNVSIDAIVFAVTSSNHLGTKRNPLPFHQRAMMLQDFSDDLPVNSFIFGIQDVGTLEDFAEYTLKTIAHESDRKLNLTPENTLVVCSTKVLKMYQKNGFRVLPAELLDLGTKKYKTPLPWDYVQQISESDNWLIDNNILSGIHSATQRLWANYELGDKIKTILQDPIIGEDGDITESRDYSSYVRQMDDIAELKFKETAPFIQPGSIGDIGCAVGSWMKLACEDQKLQESDFYGIEVARQLYDLCLQRKNNGEFNNPSVFFAMKNAVTSLVFAPDSMNTIHTSSLTHEIESYGCHQDLLDFIQNRYNELKPGGVWINRDVIGPENGDDIVFMRLNSTDGKNDNVLKECSSREELQEHLDSLSTHAKFIRFAQDFRKEENYEVKYKLHPENVVELSYRDASDFILTKDYTGNWKSEMHETFCFWSFSDWKGELERTGFRVESDSKDYQNPWILENRWMGRVELFKDAKCEVKQDFPPTNMLMVAKKI